MKSKRTVELYSKKIIGNYRKNSGTSVRRAVELKRLIVRGTRETERTMEMKRT